MSKVLLVEDEELNRVLVRAILSRSGDDTIKAIDLTEAGDIKAAREVLDGGTFDLILLDVNLPDGNGLSLARDLADHEGRPQVVALTASVLPHERAAALAAGCDGFLDKPYAAQELVDLLVERLA